MLKEIGNCEIVTHFVTNFEQCLKAANQKRAKSPVSLFSWGLSRGASTNRSRTRQGERIFFVFLWHPDISIVHHYFSTLSNEVGSIKFFTVVCIWTVTNPWIHRFLVKKTPMHEFHLASSFLWRRRTNYVISSLVVQVQLQV